MKKLTVIFSVLLTVALVTACKDSKSKDAKTTTEQSTQTDQRIVSLNGAITEIVCALGHGDQLVGRDVTSTYPEWVQDSVKDLGHVRSLTMEALIAQKPTVILASSRDMNPDLEKMIKDSGVEFKIFEQDFSVKGTKKLIKEVADFIGNKTTQPMIDKIDQDLKAVNSFETTPKVLFVYARGAGTMMVAGDETPMAKMIALAGGQNAVTGFKNFKPLTAEALLNSNPDVILLFNSGLKSLGGVDGMLKIPGVSETNAGKNKAVITMDGALLSGFGPRVGEAAAHLNHLLAPYAK